jgi:hypothetical protein
MKYQVNRHLIKEKKADLLADWHKRNIFETWTISLERYNIATHTTYFESLKYGTTVESLVPEPKYNRVENVTVKLKRYKSFQFQLTIPSRWQDIVLRGTQTYSLPLDRDEVFHRHKLSSIL